MLAEFESNIDQLRRLATVECHDATCHTQKNPIVLSKALGSRVWDVEGKEYIDLCAGFGSLPIGHNHPDIIDIFQKFSKESTPPQILHGLGDLYPSSAKIQLMTALESMLPPQLKKGLLSITGSGAVEAALKTALIATRKSHFIVFDGCYHGLDFGSLAATYRRDFKAPFKSHLAQSHFTHVPYGLPVDELENLVSDLQISGDLAGVLVEPVQGRGGIKVASTSWLQDLRGFCDAHSACLIYDEVYTGLGRIGSMTTAQDVPCDLLCLGKALGGGMPLSACFGTQEIMDLWPKSAGEAIHTGTFFGHPLSCLVGLRTISMIKDHALCQRSKQLGEEAIAKMRSFWSHRSIIRDIRGRGLMLCIEFGKDAAGETMMLELRKQGVIAIPCGTNARCLSITPALNIEAELLETAFEKIDQCMKAIEN